MHSEPAGEQRLRGRPWGAGAFGPLGCGAVLKEAVTVGGGFSGLVCVTD